MMRLTACLFGGNKIGKLIKIDDATSNAPRGRFARLCVEVDVSIPLLIKFKLRRQCGRYGHWKYTCPSSVFLEQPEPKEEQC
ncbi:conserved hypothetical protein [Ricinus communis]|uniref:Zinc knuckle CX2CX4HX4C domain-containing protein n=1 Tax=Ricinus communis TaxID=3988 RepID=B9SYG4_RICCO|nr:conserved hypothetical protein [Ricinus communis]